MYVVVVELVRVVIASYLPVEGFSLYIRYPVAAVIGLHESLIALADVAATLKFSILSAMVIPVQVSVYVPYTFLEFNL